MNAPSYLRRLSLFDAVMVVGAIIGAGIFLNPAIVAQRVGTPALVLTAWGIVGAVALVGALIPPDTVASDMHLRRVSWQPSSPSAQR